MADTTPHVGGDHWNGWIPDCPCSRCAEGLAKAKARTPVKLRVVGGEDGSGRLPTRPSERPGGWANERRSLLALAVALEHLVGEGPDPYAGWTAELAGWFDRKSRAVAMLAEAANLDAGLLRSLAGPPDDDDSPRRPGAGLLVSAAVRIETL